MVYFHNHGSVVTIVNATLHHMLMVTDILLDKSVRMLVDMVRDLNTQIFP
jgi:hypothetical protein